MITNIFDKGKYLTESGRREYTSFLLLHKKLPKIQPLKTVLIISHFAWISVWGWLSQVHCLESHEAAVKVFGRALVSSEPWGSLQSSCDCWPNLFPFLCRTPGRLLLQDQQETLFLKEGPSRLLRLYLIKAGPPGQSPFE